MVSEFRFSVSGWRCYHVGVLAILAALTAVACTGETLTLWGGPAFRLPVGYELIMGCIAVALAGTLLLALLANIWEAVRTWLRWRQFSQPAAVISSDGVRYQPRGPEVTFGWCDIEQLELHQYHQGRRTVASMYVRLTPEAAARECAGSSLRVQRGSRTLSVGNLDQIDVPADTAIPVLRRLAGTRLAIRS
jgi:hypothetical protein